MSAEHREADRRWFEPSDPKAWEAALNRPQTYKPALAALLNPTVATISEVLSRHVEGALTCYDHDGEVWCCDCGDHAIPRSMPWRDHVAHKITDALKEDA